MKKFNLYYLMVLVGLSCSQPLQAQISTTEKKIDSLFAEWNSPENPGASIAVVKGGEIIFKKGYGMANLEYGIPNSPSTVFHIASISKQFTVFSILLLQEEGKLSLNDDIREYIPEVPDFGQTITLRHLASHTSGMRDQWNLLVMAGWRFDDVITKEHVLTLVSRQKELNFNPGDEYFYCNTGFTLLAEVVARVSGKSFAEFTQERIFRQLEMSSTLFYDDHEKIVKNRAYSYHPDDVGFKKSVLSYANVGATSLFTTVEDLSKWTYNFKTVQVGSKAIIDEMNTPATLNNGKTFGGALGQFVNTYKGLNQIQHGGADAGYRTYLGRFPDQDFAVIVFSNSSNFNPGGMALKVVDIYLKNEIKEPENEAKKIDIDYIKLSTKQLESFTGYYWNNESKYSRKIDLRNDTLRYVRGPNSSSDLAPIAKNKFKMLNVDVELIVEFKKDDNNSSMVVTVNEDEPAVSMAYEPIPFSKKWSEFEGTYYSDELGTNYTINLDGEKLVANHLRTGDISLTRIMDDNFTGSKYFFGNIEFTRDDTGMINGFKVSNGRVRNLWFEKEPLSN